MTDNNQITEHFMDIFENNLPLILKISRAYTKTKQDREDLINDIAIELWKSFNKFEGKSKISTWIYRVALNTAMNSKRQKKNEYVFFNEAENINWLDESSDDPEINLLYECIEKLDEINKALIILYLDGNSHDEISEITGISKTNVGTKISRIKKQLKSIAINNI
jgi:RNA polymerase sigma-70 factor (ECF subfamily)